MITPYDTHITFFGGGANPAAIAAVAGLAAAGYDVVAASHDPRETVALREAGIPFVKDRFEALSDCQVVITSLRGPEEVESLYLGENGLFELMEPGSYAVDVTFSTPRLAREIQAMGAVSDINVLDAPIVNLGEKERPVTFIGGTPEAIDALSPLYPYFADKIFPQSDVGEGQFAAMIGYISLAGSIMGAIEGMSLARAAGYDESAAIGVLASTAGGSRALVDYIPRMLARDYSGDLKIYDFLKALKVALLAAEDLDITVPLVETAYQLVELISVVGGEDYGIHALSLLYESEEICAENGIDWALAEDLPNMNAAPGAGTFEDFLRSAGEGEGPDQGFGGNGGHGRGNGGIPPLDSFFSRN